MPPAALLKEASLSPDRARWIDAFRRVRLETERRAAPLSAEDQAIQSMPDASPTKWHLAHTTWFFETFILDAARPGRKPFHPRFRVLFNSYAGTEVKIAGEEYLVLEESEILAVIK